MTAVKPVLDAYLELNFVLILSVALWFAARFVLSRTSMRLSFSDQFRLLRALVLCLMLSPVLAFGVAHLFEFIWPGQPMAIGDVAVAAYLRGEIALPATQFETLLNTRQRWVEAALDGSSVWAIAALAALALVSAMLVIRVIWAALQIRQTVLDSFLWKRSAKVDVRLSDHIKVPFAVRGLRRRHVILPSNLLNDRHELRFAIAHEFQHVRGGDVEWELVLEFLRPLFFWNPAYHILRYQFERLRELGCDQAIVARRRLDTVDYAKCLLDYCARTVTRERPQVLNVALVNGNKAKRVLRQRIIALADGPKGGHPLHAMVLSFSLIFAIVLAWGSASLRQTDGWSHDRLMLSTVVNLERLERRNSGN